MDGHDFLGEKKNDDGGLGWWWWLELGENLVCMSRQSHPKNWNVVRQIFELERVL